MEFYIYFFLKREFVLRVENFCYEYDLTGDFEHSLKAFPIYSKDMIVSIKMGDIPRKP